MYMPLDSTVVAYAMHQFCTVQDACVDIHAALLSRDCLLISALHDSQTAVIACDGSLQFLPLLPFYVLQLGTGQQTESCSCQILLDVPSVKKET